MPFDSEARVFVLGNWHKIQLCDKFYSLIFMCLTPIGCMILIKEYVFLTTAAMKMGKIHFQSDHSNSC